MVTLHVLLRVSLSPTNTSADLFITTALIGGTQIVNWWNGNEETGEVRSTTDCELDENSDCELDNSLARNALSRTTCSYPTLVYIHMPELRS